jgi:hypothetical protein
MIDLFFSLHPVLQICSALVILICLSLALRFLLTVVQRVVRCGCLVILAVVGLVLILSAANILNF